MKTAEWKQIEKDFIEWDNASHSNASQRQVLDWFEKRFKSEALPEISDEEIEKMAPYKGFVQGEYLYRRLGWIEGARKILSELSKRNA